MQTSSKPTRLPLLAIVLVMLSGITAAAATGITAVTGNLDMNTGSTLAIEINGTTAGTLHDQITVSGSTDLDADSGGGATLDIQLGYAPANNDSYIIIDTAITHSGTFNGLAEGASFAADGTVFTISYAGGSGTDVELTASVPSVSFSTALAAVVFEGQAVSVIVTRTGATGAATSVEVNDTGGGTDATAATDYTDIYPVGLTFAIGETSKSFTFTALAAGRGGEGDEFVEFELTVLSNAEPVAPTSLIATIKEFNAVPYAENFDGRTVGDQAADLPGWTEGTAGNSTIVTGGAAATALAAYGGTQPNGGGGGNFLEVGDEASVYFEPATGVVAADFLVTAVRRSSAPSVDATATAGIYFTSTGSIGILHNDAGGTDEWLTPTANVTLVDGAFARIGLIKDYTNGRFQVWVDAGDGTPVALSDNTDGGSTPSSGDDGGTWFDMVGSPASFTRLVFVNEDPTTPYYVDALDVSQPSVTLSAAAYGDNETDAPSSQLVTVNRTGSLVHVPILTLTDQGGGTAIAGTDYTNTPPIVTISFASEATTQTVSFPVLNDTVPEAPSDETVNFQLTVTGGASLGATTDAVYTITDDDNFQPVIVDTATPSFTTTEDAISGVSFTITEVEADVAPGVDLFFDGDGDPLGLAFYAFAGLGTWEFSTDNEVTYATVPTVNLTSALVLSAAHHLRYTGDSISGETATATFYGWDATDGAQSGRLVDASVRVNLSAFSIEDEVLNVVVASINDQTAATNLTQFISYNEDTTNVDFTDIVVTDVDVDEQITVTLTLDNATTGALSTAFGGTYAAPTWTITDSVANVNAALAAVQFLPVANNNTDTTVNIVISDGLEDATTTLAGTILLHAAPINDAPVLIENEDYSFIFTENANGGAGNLVSAILDQNNPVDPITDVDAASVEGIAIYATNIEHVNNTGVFQFSTNGGTDWIPVPTPLSPAGALLLRATDLVRFEPDTDNGTETTYSFYAWDQTPATTGLHGTTFDVANAGTGGTAPFSSATELVSVTVTPVNDVPVITLGSTTVFDTDDQTTINPFTSVVLDDVDEIISGANNGDPLDTLSVSVSIDSCFKGTLSNAVAQGFTVVDSYINFQTRRSQTADETTALDVVVLHSKVAGTTTAPISVTVVDSGTGSAGGGDYAAALATVVFPIGAADGDTGVVTITPSADTDTEGNETVDLAITTLSGPAILGSLLTHEVSIADEDNPFISFDSTGVTIGEADVTRTVNVTLSIPNAGGPLVSAAYFTVSDAATGTATVNSDYTAFTSTILTFPAGSVDGDTLSVTLDVLDDVTFDTFEETIVLVLTALTGPVPLTLQEPFGYTITVQDNETAGTTVPIVYTISGTTTATTTALQGLTFTPTNNRIMPGSTDITTFTISVTDNVDASIVRDSQTLVRALSQNDAPTLTNPNPIHNINDNKFVAPFTAALVSDIDNYFGNPVGCPNAGVHTPAQILTMSVTVSPADSGEVQHRITSTDADDDDDFDLWVSSPQSSFDGVTVEILDTRTDGGANAAYNAVDNTLTINITSGVTCAFAVVEAVNAVAEFSAELNLCLNDTTNDGSDPVTSKTITTNFAHLSEVSPGLYVSNSGNRDTVANLLSVLSFRPTENFVAVGNTSISTIDVAMSDGVITVTDSNTVVNALSINTVPTVATQTYTVFEDALAGTVVGTVVGTDVDPTDGVSNYTLFTAGGSGATAFSVAAGTGIITVLDPTQLDHEIEPQLKLNVNVTDDNAGQNVDYDQQIIVPCDELYEQLFGSSVAISGDLLVVGANRDAANPAVDPESGAAYVYRLTNQVWQQEGKLVASDRSANDHFGTSVAADGTTIVVGAENQDDGRGAAYVYVYAAGFWTQQQILTASTREKLDFFGTSVGIDGDTIVVGVPKLDGIVGDVGGVVVYDRTAGVWSETQVLYATDFAPLDLFGVSVDIDGTTIAVGASGEDDAGSGAGAGYIFTLNAGTWSQQAKLQASDGDTADAAGSAIAVSGEFAIVGAPADDGTGGIDSGSAYVWEREGTSWNQQQKVEASDAEASDRFGSAVSIDGTRFAVAAAYDDDTATDAGAVYTFEQSDAEWVQDTKEVASDGEADDRYGVAIDLDGTTLVVGAPFSNNAELSVTADEDAGAVYVENLDEGAVCISILDANDTPVYAGQSFSFDENTANATTVGTVIATDQDTGDTLTFVFDPVSAVFTLASATSTTAYLQVADVLSLNYEVSPSFTLTSRVNDDGTGTLSAVATITVYLNDINEAPEVLDQAFTSNENEVAGTALGTVVVIEEDANDNVVLTITSGNDSGGFAIDPTTFVLSVADASVLDFETTPIFTLNVLTTDAAGLTDTAIITVNLTNVLEPPVAVDQTFTALETAIPANFTVVATDENSIASFAIQTGNESGAFTPMAGATGALDTAAAQSFFEATQDFSLSVLITDDEAQSTLITVTVTFVEVNEDPVLLPIGAQAVDELVQLTFVAVATDADLPAQTLSYSLDVAALAAGATIDSSTGTFSWTPTEAQGGNVYNMTVSVTDSEGAIDTEIITITVSDVNSAPILANIGTTKYVNEGASLAFTANATDSDDPTDTLAFSLSTFAPPAPSVTSPSITTGGAFEWTPQAGDVGTYTVYVVVSDGTITDSSLLTIIVEVAGSGATADVVWTDLTDVTNPAGSELVRDVDEEGHLAWTAGAISVQEIAGDDCFVRTTIIETDTDRILGFGDVYNRDNRVSEFIYGVWIRSGGYLNTLLNGVLEFKGGTVTYQTGDEVEVAIVGTTVVYKLNGTVFATSGRPVLRDDYPLRIEAGLLQDNATLSNVVTCPTVPASPYITGLAIEDPTEADDVYGVGDKFTISFNIETNQPNASFNDLFTMSESPGTLSGAWANATTYCATVTDTGGLSNIRIGVTTVVPNLGGTAIQDATAASAASDERSPVLTGRFGTTKLGSTPVTWTNLHQMTASGADITAANVVPSILSGATSTQSFAYGDLTVTFTIEDDFEPNGRTEDTLAGAVIGITNDSDVEHPDDLMYAFGLGQEQVWVRERTAPEIPVLSTSTGPSLGTYVAGDVFCIQLSGTTVSYLKNNTVVFTSTLALPVTLRPLYIGTSIQNGTLSNVRYIGDDTLVAPPTLVSAIANDADNANGSVDGVDTITLTLSEASNAPGGVGVDQDKAAIDALFTSSTASSRAANVLGADYDGSWTDASNFVITLTDSTGHNLVLDTTLFGIAGETQITNAAATSGYATVDYGTVALTGDFGQFREAGIAVTWENSVNTTDGGSGTLNKTSALDLYDAFADSTQVVLEGDTFVEIRITDLGTTFQLGWREIGDPALDYSLDFSGQHNLFVPRVRGESPGTFGTVRLGDIVRVRIVGSSVLYQVNDETRHTADFDSRRYPLEVFARIFTANGSLTEVRMGDPALAIAPTVVSAVWDDVDDADPSANLLSVGDTLTITFDQATTGAGADLDNATVNSLFVFRTSVGATASYGNDLSGTWTSNSVFVMSVLNTQGGSTPSIGDVQIHPGTTFIAPFGFTALEAWVTASPVTTGDYGEFRNAGEEIQWNNVVNGLATDNTLTRSSNLNGPTGAVSAQCIARGTRSDSYIEFTAGTLGGNTIFGFSADDTSAEPTNILFGAQLAGSGLFQVWENLGKVGTFGSWAEGDTIRVALTRTQSIQYLVNGVVRYTSQRPAVNVDRDLPFYANAYMNETNSQAINNAIISAPPELVSFVQTDVGGGFDFLLTLTLSVAGSQPGGAAPHNATVINQIWTFDAALGAAYTGGWADNLTYVISVSDELGSTLESGVTTVTAAGTLPITQEIPTNFSPAANGFATLQGLFASDDNGYPIPWFGVLDATIDGDNNLVGNAGASIWGGLGCSSSSLTAGDGFVQFTIDDPNAALAFGFVKTIRTADVEATGDVSLQAYDLAAHVLAATGSLAVIDNGQTVRPHVATLAEDDVVRVEYAGTQRYVTVNSVRVYTSSRVLVDADYPVSACANIGTPGSTLYDPRVSWTNRPILQSLEAGDFDDDVAAWNSGDFLLIKFAQDTDRGGHDGSDVGQAGVDALFTFENPFNGGIVSLGTAYNGRWLDHKTFQIIVSDVTNAAGIQVGQLRVKPTGTTPILDAVGPALGAADAPSPLMVGDFGVVNKVVWIAQKDVTATENTIARTGFALGDGLWKAGAHSSTLLVAGDADITITATGTDEIRAIGFTSQTDLVIGPYHDVNTLEFGVTLEGSGSLHTYHTPPGRYTRHIGTYAEGDDITVSLTGGTYSVSKNGGAPLHSYTPPTGIGYPLRVRGSILVGTLQDAVANIPAAAPKPVITAFGSTGDGSGTITDGDTLTIDFDKVTNTPPGLVGTWNAPIIHDLFDFSDGLDADMTGTWTNDSLFTISVVNVRSTGMRVGYSTITPNADGPRPIRAVGTGLSFPADQPSPVLTGTARSAGGSEAVAAQATIELASGWNLVSTPVAPSDVSPAAVFGDLADSVRTYLNSEQVAASSIEVGAGYWVFNPGAETSLLVVGTAAASGSVALTTGWNVVGVGAPVSVPAGAIARKQVGDDYVTVATLEPGIGYWIFVDEPSSLTW